MKVFILCISLLVPVLHCYSQSFSPPHQATEKEKDEYSLQNYKKSKFSALLITLLTGPLGGHRIYLGSKPIVPVVYALTLGGGLGLLPIIDFFYLLFSKNIEESNNDQIILFGKKKVIQP